MPTETARLVFGEGFVEKFASLIHELPPEPRRLEVLVKIDK